MIMTKTTTAKKTANDQSPLELAEATLRTLEQKRARLAAKREDDDKELAQISYQAHTGDKDAAERVDAIRERKMKREIEIQTLDFAIVTAGQKVEETKACARAEAEIVALTELRGLANVLREAGEQADDALTILGEAAVTMGDTISAINRLGVGNPSVMQLQSLGERAIKTALMNHPWSRGFEHLGHSDKRNFAGFTSDWARKLESDIERKLEQLNPNHGGAA
jgi:hypothetical protein